MIVQGLSSVLSSYNSDIKTSVFRQNPPSGAADVAVKVTISDAAKAMMNATAAASQDMEVQNRLNAIKAKPGIERTEADFEYLSANDKRFAKIQEKIKANGNNGFDSLTADEVDYMQKAGGFVNTMAQLSSSERALYDELVAQGNVEAAHGLALVGMARVGMSGQQVELPNGKRFDPAATEVTAANIQNLFKWMFVDPSGNTDRQFAALASYLEQREASNKA